MARRISLMFCLITIILFIYACDGLGIGAGEKSAVIEGYVYNAVDTTGIDKAVVYYDWDVPNSSNFILLDSTSTEGKYQLSFLNWIHEGYLLVTHELYYPDTVEIERSAVGATMKIDFYLSRR